MKKRYILGCSALLAFNLFLSGPALAGPGLISYQGKLTDNSGTPLEGAQDVAFRIYDAASGGTQLWSETQNNIQVVDGIYNVQLGAATPLSATIFAGDSAYLEVWVWNASTSSWEILIPRQRLTSTAYAFKAADADTLDGQDSSAFGDITEVTAGTGLTGGGASGSVNVNIGAGTGITTAADAISVDTTVIQQRVAGTCPAGQSIRVVNPDGSVQCENDDTGVTTETDPTVLASVKDGIAWSEISTIPAGFSDGIDNDSGGDITGVTAGTGLLGGGTSGTVTISAAIPFTLSGSVSAGLINAFNEYSTSGYGLYGYASGSSGRGVYGRSSGSGGTGVYGYSYDDTATNYGGYFYARGLTGYGVYGSASNAGGTNYGGRFYAAGISGYGVYGHASADTGANYGGYFESDGNRGKGIHAKVDNPGSGLKYAGYFEVDSETGYGVYSGVNGKYTNWAFRGEATGTGSEGAWFSTVGENTRAVYGNASGTTGTYNTNKGGQFIAAGSHGYGVHAQATGTYGTGIYATGGSSGKAAVFLGNVQIKRKSDDVVVMELGAGLDYAEGFDVADNDGIEPGSVLVIDPENPGKLALSSKAYDTRVAGIVAGANNLGSGVRLGAGEFDHDVALAGRVYCNVDASQEAIEPGDLLTSSSIPGYAMKVKDHGRSQGAIIGKAMEKLEKGEKGQILVLVTLQ